MKTSWIAAAFARDLKSLKREISAYPDERDLWKVVPGISNSGGNLALHLAGNVRYFIGAVLGSNGYIRDRNAEFSRKDVPRAEVLTEIGYTGAELEQLAATFVTTARRMVTDHISANALHVQRPTAGG